MSRINHLIILIFLFSCLFSFNNGEHGIKNNIICLDVEREALLGFKGSLIDTYGLLFSWKGKDCCLWRGAGCRNNTISGGLHVTRLDLISDYDAPYSLNGNINFTSLYALEFLDYLDLSSNICYHPRLNSKIEGLKNLKYLNLSHMSFSGEISPHLGNLSSLKYLDLSNNYNLKATNLWWLTYLTSLVYLNLDHVILEQTREGWFDALNKLPSLEELHLSKCGLLRLPYSIPLNNLTLISILDLSNNNFNSSVPPWLFNLTSLVELDLHLNPFGGVMSDYDFSNFEVLEILSLHYTDIEGGLPRNLGSICKLKQLDLRDNKLNGTMNEFLQTFSSCPDGNSLRYLYLSGNQLEGEIPASIEVLRHLQHLHLDGNKFSGMIPQTSIGQLEELTDLSLGDNCEDVVTEFMFMNLNKLEKLYISSNKVIFNVTLDWIPPFRLTYFSIKISYVSKKIPKWILEQSKLTSLTLRNVGISDIFPENWISILISRGLSHLDLAKNQILGKLPHNIQLESPKMAHALYQIDLSRNSISGQVPSWICIFTNCVQLSYNQLSGSLPDCFNNESYNMRFLDISHNSLTGKLPSSIFRMSRLDMLLLSDNHLEGELPLSIQNSSLWSLDVGGNKLIGRLPTRPPAAGVLRLRSNYFHGPIPK